jgi:hypothetical protein
MKFKRALTAVACAALATAGAITVAAPASAIACDPADSTTCDWTYPQSLYWSQGAISWGRTSPCWFEYDIYLSQKKATTWGEASCDQSAVRLYYAAGSWAGWTSWKYSETLASISTSGAAVQ